MIASFTLQEEELLCRVAWDGGIRHWLPCFKLEQEAPFSISLRLFNKIFFKQQHAKNATKSANIDVLELLNLQNVLLRLQP